jgi:hypothetical protein
MLPPPLTLQVPVAERDFVEYNCYAHDDDLSPTEKAAIIAWAAQFR